MAPDEEVFSQQCPWYREYDRETRGSSNAQRFMLDIQIVKSSNPTSKRKNLELLVKS